LHARERRGKERWGAGEEREEGGGRGEEEKGRSTSVKFF